MKQIVHDSTQHLTMEDLRAIASYLKSVPAQAEEEKAGEATPDVAMESGETGKGIYTGHCADCHGEQGKGEWPAYPPLAGNPTVSAISPINVIRVVSQGGFGVVTESEPHPHSMPPFAAHELTPSEIAEVVTYIRTI